MAPRTTTVTSKASSSNTPPKNEGGRHRLKGDKVTLRVSDECYAKIARMASQRGVGRAMLIEQAMEHMVDCDGKPTYHNHAFALTPRTRELLQQIVQETQTNPNVILERAVFLLPEGLPYPGIVGEAPSTPRVAEMAMGAVAAAPSAVASAGPQLPSRVMLRLFDRFLQLMFGAFSDPALVAMLLQYEELSGEEPAPPVSPDTQG